MHCALCFDDLEAAAGRCPGNRCVLCSDCFADVIQFQLDECTVCGAEGMFHEVPLTLTENLR